MANRAAQRVLNVQLLNVPHRQLRTRLRWAQFFIVLTLLASCAQRPGVPEIDVDLTTIDFGAARIDIPEERPLSIRNRGAAPLVIDSLSILGDGAAYFSLQRTEVMEVKPNQEVVFYVRYSRAALGDHEAAVRVVSNASGATELFVTLRGTTEDAAACARVPCHSPPGPCFEPEGTCVDGQCTYAPMPEGTSCNDGNACTKNDVCTQASCGGTALVCAQSCDPLTGQCADCPTAFIPCDEGCCAIPASPVGRITCGLAHSCAVNTSTGQVKCWGLNDEGQLALDGGHTQATDIVPQLDGGVLSVGAGYRFNCALMTGKGVKCWGQNDHGQLGNNSIVASNFPVQVYGLTSGVSSVAIGTLTACALLDGGTVKCWGEKVTGKVNLVIPASIAIEGIGTALGVGHLSSCVLLTTGGVKCWGTNSYGQVGNGTKESQPTPTDVTGLTSGVLAIASGQLTNCALMSSGGVKCWGQAVTQVGELLTPTDVPGLDSGVAQVAVGSGFLCALMTTGAVKCIGDNTFGQIGNGFLDGGLFPLSDVIGLTRGVTELASGLNHVCATLQTGAVQCWGRNTSGQLGDGTTTHAARPVTVLGL